MSSSINSCYQILTVITVIHLLSVQWASSFFLSCHDFFLISSSVSVIEARPQFVILCGPLWPEGPGWKRLFNRKQHSGGLHLGFTSFTVRCRESFHKFSLWPLWPFKRKKKCSKIPLGIWLYSDGMLMLLNAYLYHLLTIILIECWVFLPGCMRRTSPSCLATLFFQVFVLFAARSSFLDTSYMRHTEKQTWSHVHRSWRNCSNISKLTEFTRLNSWALKHLFVVFVYVCGWVMFTVNLDNWKWV